MEYVGLLVNPMAGRDIRRLVARASLTSATDKLQAARRLIAGVKQMSDVGVLMMDDWEGLGRTLAHEFPKRVRLVPGLEGQRPTSSVSTRAGAQVLESEGARLLIVVGGDGTQRNAAEAAPTIPLLAMAGGTNNVACWLGDETVAGYAAAVWVCRRPPLEQTATQVKLIHVASEREPETLALIDVALVRQRYTGAMAVWNADDVAALVMAVADPGRPGLSNVGGMVSPVHPYEDAGLAVTFNPDANAPSWVQAVLAPGLMAAFAIQSWQRFALHEPIAWRPSAGGSLALDGERTLVLAPDETVQLEVRRDGPWFLDPGRILHRALGL